MRREVFVRVDDLAIGHHRGDAEDEQRGQRQRQHEDHLAKHVSLRDAHERHSHRDQRRAEKRRGGGEQVVLAKHQHDRADRTEAKEHPRRQRINRNFANGTDYADGNGRDHPDPEQPEPVRPRHEKQRRDREDHRIDGSEQQKEERTAELHDDVGADAHRRMRHAHG